MNQKVKKQSLQKKPGQAGFGLVEVLVSIAIFMIISVVIFDLYFTTYANWDNAKSKNIAYNILQETVEEIRNLRDTNVVAGVDDSGAKISWDNKLDAFSGTKTSNPDGAREYTTKVDVTNPTTVIDGKTITGVKKKVVVTVSWVGRNGPKQIQAITYLDDWKQKF